MDPQDRDEKDFLHALAGPLSSAIFFVDEALEEAKNGSQASHAELTHLQDAAHELKAIKTLLQNRRETLYKKGTAA